MPEPLKEKKEKEAEEDPDGSLKDASAEQVTAASAQTPQEKHQENCSD